MILSPGPQAFRGRIGFLTFIVVLGFAIVLGGYYRVQILNRERYEALGEKYRLKRMRQKASRGLIYDRDERLITQNMPAYTLILARDEMTVPWRQFKPTISAFLGIPEEKLQKRYDKRSHLFSEPILLVEDIPFIETLRIKRHQRRFPGLGVATSSKRFYTHDQLFAHVLGYVGEASPQELKAKPRFRMGDYVGKNGVELAYDGLLTGTDGEKLIHIDSRGVYRHVELAKPPIPGGELYLTINFELQKLALKALEGYRGSIVMMDIETGDLLVYVSAPSFDLNLFTSGISNETWQNMISSPDRPFLNRPLKGLYAPGSIFKIVSALTALKYQKVTPDTKFFCSGSATFFNREYHCHQSSGHGWVDLGKAIQHSCNIYFWNVASGLDADKLAEVAYQLGFGRKTGVDMIGEKSGTLPTPAWKKVHLKEMWYPGDTLNQIIGQGNLQTTPLQLVQLMAIVGSKGKVVQPHILLKSIQNGKTEEFVPKTRVIDTLPEEYFSYIKDAMWRVVNEGGGTGSKAAIPGFDVCGKTGTAQLITFKTEEEYKIDAYKNALFAAFAPKENARVAIVVVLEKAGGGGAAAAPIARRLLEAYRKLRIKVNPS